MLSRIRRLLRRWFRGELNLAEKWPVSPYAPPSGPKPLDKQPAPADRLHPRGGATPVSGAAATATPAATREHPPALAAPASWVSPTVEPGDSSSVIPLGGVPSGAANPRTTEVTPPKVTEIGTVEEPIVLTDLSGVRYSVDGGGYPPPPPGWDAAAVAASPRRWSRRSSRLRPALVTVTVRDLRARADGVALVVDEEPVEVLWPGADENRPGDFRVSELDPSYLVSRGESQGHPRTLDLALPGAEGAERAVDDFDRLELVRLIAILLDGLHRHDVVTACLDWQTFAFALDPRPGVVLRAPEALRRLGGEFLEAPGADVSPDEMSGGPFDADRYRFALLAFRLLVSHEQEGAIESRNRRGIPGLSTTQLSRVWGLWERSAGAAGTRPQATEWREALGA
jgi:hypothetical protein